MERLRFGGHVAGIGTTSGLRAVVGRWSSSPFGTFSDVMIETAEGHRVLLAPSETVAGFVAATYSFDEVRVEPVQVTDEADRVSPSAWHVETPSLELWVGIGPRTLLGSLLRLVPRRVATAPPWSRVTDPAAQLLLRGVRTRGSAGGGRTEVYGATDVRRVTSASGRLDGHRLGALAPIDPPCRFGFSSVPRTPSVTEVVTTVLSEDDSGRPFSA